MGRLSAHILLVDGFAWEAKEMKKDMVCAILLCVGLIAGAAGADVIYPNGDFEADLWQVPNPGDVNWVLPTGWEVRFGDDRYDDTAPGLRNVSAIGDGTGGQVGAIMPNWYDDAGWNTGLARFEAPIVPGDYHFRVTLAGIGLTDGRNEMFASLHWTDDPADPWKDENDGIIHSGSFVDTDGDPVGTGAQVLDEDDNEIWFPFDWDFIVEPDDPAVGNYFVPWIYNRNYDGHLLLGEASLTGTPAPPPDIPEPATLAVVCAGFLPLLRRRKAGRKA